MNEPNKTNQDPLIVIVSNRGPYSFAQREDGDFEVQRGSGGLVTALGALAEKHEVLWVASAMSADDRAWAAQQNDRAADIDDIHLRLITPEPAQYEQYYNVIANPLLWFVQHELWNIPRTPSITAETWQAWREGYTAVNQLFAEAVADSIAGTDRPVIVLPQDYHLYLLPAQLRALVGDEVHIQPFVHIPWPGIDAWRILPEAMRDEILNSMLQSDRVGFQTTKDAFNFVQNCRFYLPGVHSRGTRDTLYHDGKTTVAKAYPISVDVQRTKELVDEPQTKLLKSQLINIIGDQRLILRVDRIEPSKNILRGLEAFANLLAAYPQYKGKVKLLALLVPSRLEVDEYQDYLRDIMAQAGLINAQYSDPFWEPIRVIVGDNYHRAIAAMQLYDVLLVNPIADGMNLVAKEGALVNERNGRLILSEHAGAFYELHEDALIVSPFDVYGTAEAIHAALSMPTAEREARAYGMRRVVEEAGVQHWFDNQVRDALTSAASQASRASTSATSPARRSAALATDGGPPGDQTPTP